MKKATLIIWVIIFGIIALVIFQNQAFFLTNQSLRVNLGIIDEYNTPEIPIAILLLFFSGIVIAYLFNVAPRYKANRTNKKLNAAVAAHNNEVTELKREISSLKGEEVTEQVQSAESQTEIAGTQKEPDIDANKDSAEKTAKLEVKKPTANPTDTSNKLSNEKTT
jgi:uncharacterized integral membrane protein